MNQKNATVMLLFLILLMAGLTVYGIIYYQEKNNSPTPKDEVLYR